MKTQTGLVIDVERSKETSTIIYLVIDGEPYPLTAADAEAIGKWLRDEAVRP